MWTFEEAVTVHMYRISTFPKVRIKCTVTVRAYIFSFRHPATNKNECQQQNNYNLNCDDRPMDVIFLIKKMHLARS